MIEAAWWGLVGASSLLLGAILALRFHWPPRWRGLLLAFGAGTLLGAVAYELIEEAVRSSATAIEVGIGFALGAVVFFVGSVRIDAMADAPAAPGASTARPTGDGPDGRLESRRRARTQGLAVVLGAILDGIPESVVLGMSLLSGSIGVPVLAAIFISNVPEGLSASDDLHKGGFRSRQIIGLWVAVAFVSAIASGLGFALLETAPAWLVAGIQAFAGGAILAMLAESMFPEANELGGRPVGLATCFGFALAAYLSLSV
jgi:ZIP family zinc transporter